MRDGDPLVKYLAETVYTIGIIAALIVLGVRHGTTIPIGFYIAGCIVLAIVNSLTFLPISTILFIVLKLLGVLTIGWFWIPVAVILDALSVFYVIDFRKGNSH